MKIVESYMPVFQKWGDNRLCVYRKSNPYADPPDAFFDSYFLYYGYKLTYVIHVLHVGIGEQDLRELMMVYKTGRAV